MSGPLERVWSYILNSVDEGGCWNLDNYDEWAPVTTALIVDLLLRCGVDPTEEWVSGKVGQPRRFCVDHCLNYLDGQIRTDGSFGEDLWDAARFAEIIVVHKLTPRIPAAPRLLEYVAREVEQGRHLARDAGWDGPGVIAAIASYFISAGERELAAKCIAELSSQQSVSGEFRGSVGSDGNDLVSPVWHTSQAVTAFLQYGVSEKDERVSRMVNWLTKTQGVAGNWPGFSRYEIYFTAYAVIALTRLGSPPVEALQRGVEWLKSNVSSTGKVRDVGGTVMTCVALGYAEGFRVGGSFEGLAYHNMVRAQDQLLSLQADLESASQLIRIQGDELEKFRSKFGKADFGITQAQAFMWGLASLLIGILLSLLPPTISYITQAASARPTITRTPADEADIGGADTGTRRQPLADGK